MRSKSKVEGGHFGDMVSMAGVDSACSSVSPGASREVTHDTGALE